MAILRNIVEKIFARKTRILLLAVMFFVILSGAVFFANWQMTRASVGEHLITIYNDGVEKTIISRARTVAEALKEAEISIARLDDVQPDLDAKIGKNATNINIYRARTVVIVDEGVEDAGNDFANSSGAKVSKIVTAAQSSVEILAAADVTVYPEDEVAMTTVAPADFARLGAGLEIEISRAKVVNLTLYGQDLTFRTRAATVADFLREKEISMGGQDGVDVPAEAKVRDGMALKIWRNGKQTITETEEIPFATNQIPDSTRDKGFREVREVGKTGEKNVTYEVELRDGQEISRTRISEVVVKAPVAQVEIIGAKVAVSGPVYNPNGSHEEWMRAAGIAEENFPYVEFLVQKESGWNPNARNKSSGACGLPQALPCSKLGPNWNNPVVALSWMNGYVGRYGGWAGAYAFWQAHHWY